MTLKNRYNNKPTITLIRVSFFLEPLVAVDKNTVKNNIKIVSSDMRNFYLQYNGQTTAL